MKHSCSYEFPIGNIIIEEQDGYIVKLSFSSGEAGGEDSALLREARKQLEQYFKGERKEFELPVKLKGTEFQQRVWRALREIPYGETRSYGDIAEEIGSPRAARAVGGANNKNPVMIIVPCHRVIGSDGSMVGFGGGIELKRQLLELEQRVKNTNAS